MTEASMHTGVNQTHIHAQTGWQGLIPAGLLGFRRSLGRLPGLKAPGWCRSLWVPAGQVRARGAPPAAALPGPALPGLARRSLARPGPGRAGPGQKPGDQATLTAILTRWNRLLVMCAWMRPFR